MNTLQNITFNEIAIGQTATYSKTLTQDLITLFAVVSGDINPIHIDPGYAATTRFGEQIGHGAWLGALISAAIALELPGPGTVYLRQNLTFRKPVKIGDTITVTLKVIEKNDNKHIVILECRATNQIGKIVARGTADVIAPTEKLALNAPDLPTIHIE